MEVSAGEGRSSYLKVGQAQRKGKVSVGKGKAACSHDSVYKCIVLKWKGLKVKSDFTC